MDAEQVSTRHCVISPLSVRSSLSHGRRSLFHTLVFTSAVPSKHPEFNPLSLVTCSLNTLSFVYVSLKMGLLEPNERQDLAQPEER